MDDQIVRDASDGIREATAYGDELRLHLRDQRGSMRKRYGYKNYGGAE
jgi:hypothetical protein